MNKFIIFLLAISLMSMGIQAMEMEKTNTKQKSTKTQEIESVNIENFIAPVQKIIENTKIVDNIKIEKIQNLKPIKQTIQQQAHLLNQQEKVTDQNIAGFYLNCDKLLNKLMTVGVTPMQQDKFNVQATDKTVSKDVSKNGGSPNSQTGSSSSMKRTSGQSEHDLSEHEEIHKLQKLSDYDKNTILSFMFFPDGRETYDDFWVHYALAYSAKYGNMDAMYKIKDILKDYFSDPDSGEDKSEGRLNKIDEQIKVMNQNLQKPSEEIKKALYLEEEIKNTQEACTLDLQGFSLKNQAGMQRAYGENEAAYNKTFNDAIIKYQQAGELGHTRSFMHSGNIKTHLGDITAIEDLKLIGSLIYRASEIAELKQNDLKEQQSLENIYKELYKSHPMNLYQIIFLQHG